MNKSIEYYNQNANKFFENTQGLDFTQIPEDFLTYIPENGKILELGCGSGRDAKYFKDRGFSVVAMDGSLELCKLAEKHIGQKVIHSTFEEFETDEQFDGIYACASLLHVTTKELIALLNKYSKNLKEGGCFYCSFKKGYSCLEERGRMFNRFTEETFNYVLSNLDSLSLDKYCETSDVRENRTTKWVNFFLVKRS